MTDYDLYVPDADVKAAKEPARRLVQPDRSFPDLRPGR